MGGINFGWLAVWVLRPDWLSRKLEVCDFCRRLSKAAAHGGRGVWAVPQLSIDYLGICPTTEEKSRKTLSQGNRKALGWSAPNTICLVDLVIADNGLDCRAGPCRPWLSRQVTRSTLGQYKYLPSCRTKGTAKLSQSSNWGRPLVC